MNRLTKWLIYTVVIGLLPMLCRLLLWAVTKTGTMEPFAVSDFVAFGLVLHISNINELEHYETNNPSWKTCHNGISILFITLYSVFYTVTLLELSEVDSNNILIGSSAMCVVSFLISLSLYFRVTKLELRQ